MADEQTTDELEEIFARAENAVLSGGEQMIAQRRDDEAIEDALRHFLEHPENRTDDLLEWRHIEVLIRQIDRLREARDGAMLMAAL